MIVYTTSPLSDKLRRGLVVKETDKQYLVREECAFSGTWSKRPRHWKKRDCHTDPKKAQADLIRLLRLRLAAAQNRVWTLERSLDAARAWAGEEVERLAGSQEEGLQLLNNKL